VGSHKDGGHWRQQQQWQWPQQQLQLSASTISLIGPPPFKSFKAHFKQVGEIEKNNNKVNK